MYLMKAVRTENSKGSLLWFVSGVKASIEYYRMFGFTSKEIFYMKTILIMGIPIKSPSSQ